MKRKNSTRNALVTSVISLLLCVSMLVGTTFAWFTDEVVSGMNQIIAGNLDVEVTNEDGDSIQDLDKLFSDITLWEPGVVAYENLTVANVGSLALKYNLSINFGNENTVNGYGLSDVLKVAIVEGEVTAEKRDELITNDTIEWTLLSGLNAIGDLLPDESEKFGIVIWWEPSDDDNNWNVNNGKEVSDLAETGKNQLHIDLGVKVFATQQTYEEDSFDNRYDGEAFVPVAQVTTEGPKTVTLVNEVNGERELALENSFSFKTTEDETAAAASGYRYWHADFVVKADADIKADSVALAGYYEAYAEATNTQGQWIALVSDQDVTAGDEIRLMEYMGVTGNYEELCKWIPEFLCGVKDLDGSNRGTTLTVELRLYETTIYSGDTSGSANFETGEYKTIGVYEHTFGGQWETLDDNTLLFHEYDGDVMLASVADVTAGAYIIPENVTVLNSGVFARNAGITAVTIPASVTDFGATGVSETNASSGAFKNSAVTTVVLEEGMTEIPAAAFNGATNLTSVSIPSTVTTVGVNAFRSTALTELTIPATLTNISYGAFRDMASLETVTFEGSHVDIPNYAFRGCTNLRTVNLKNADTATIGTNMAFANASSNNPNTNNITFYVKNETVGDLVKTSMGAGSYVAIFVGDTLYAEIK